MDDNKPSGVNVTVSGSDPLTVRAVAATIGDSLSERGFSSVSVNSLNAEPDRYTESSASLLEVIGRTRPHLLHSPIQVSYLYNEEREPLDIGASTPLRSEAPSQLDVLDSEVQMAQEATHMAGVVDDVVAADPGPGSEPETN